MYAVGASRFRSLVRHLYYETFVAVAVVGDDDGGGADDAGAVVAFLLQESFSGWI